MRSAQLAQFTVSIEEFVQRICTVVQQITFLQFSINRKLLSTNNNRATQLHTSSWSDVDLNRSCSSPARDHQGGTFLGAAGGEAPGLHSPEPCSCCQLPPVRALEELPKMNLLLAGGGSAIRPSRTPKLLTLSNLASTSQRLCYLAPTVANNPSQRHLGTHQSKSRWTSPSLNGVQVDPNPLSLKTLTTSTTR